MKEGRNNWFQQIALWILIMISMDTHAQQIRSQEFTLSDFAEIQEVVFDKNLGTPRLINFYPMEPRMRSDSKPAEQISRYLNLEPVDFLEKIKEDSFPSNISIQRFKRFHHGIPVEHGDYVMLVKNNILQSIHCEHYELPTASRSISMSEGEALGYALLAAPSRLYSWDAISKLIERSDLSEQMKSRVTEVCDQQFPVGHLVYIKDYYDPEEKVNLAYKFVIESVDPLFKDVIYVHAGDGHLMLRNPIIKHGTGDLRYAGTKSFPSTQINTAGLDTFELRGLDSVSGVFCETRSVDGLGGLPIPLAAVYALSSPIRDGDQEDPCPTDITATVDEFGDDVWNRNEHRKAIFDTLPLPQVSCCVNYTPNPGGCNEIQNDDIALDAQWGAQIVARYWKEKHGRLSFDNQGSPIYSFVHYGDAYNNAFWNGSFMTYGDGSYQQGGGNPNGDFAPFTSLDICAHEIGHAITSHTSDLVYQKEAGALNESLSDIWSAAIERYVLDSFDMTLPYDPFAIGEQVDEGDGGLPPGDPNARAIRWMDDPNTGLNPDTYQGTYYYPTEGPLCAQPNLSNDYCGVHLNSGVINKWYYLLTMGSGLPLSPGTGIGGMKASADDEINDLGNPYSVQGIGAEKSDQITFLAQSLLTPNALFQDMRQTSILAAQVLYGICSFEETQTTNAWYAVGVGDSFNICTPKIIFSEFNPELVLESSGSNGCDASHTIDITLLSFDATEIIEFNTSGNAQSGVDFDLLTDQISFSGTEIKTLQIIIYDDHIVESNIDTLTIAFSNSGFSDTISLFIQDDDVIPSIGDSAILLNESFIDTFLPPGWNKQLVNVESTSDWAFDGIGMADQKAYVGVPGSQMPIYNVAGHAHVRLVSPLLDARGRSDVIIAFDWGAGGEADAIETTVIFDYGTFQLSTDGMTWVDIENFVGSMGGSVPQFGHYEELHPELNNQSFYLGFKWYNDALLGSGFSFTIDEVKVNAQDLDIATAPGSMMSADLPVHEEVAFVSDSASEYIALISAGSVDLGCTQVSILENAETAIVPASQCAQRSAKVFGLNSDSSGDSLTMTIYFTRNEVEGWAIPGQLNILSVSSVDIDDLNSGFEIIDQNNIMIDDQLDSEQGFISYTFPTRTSFLSYALTDRSTGPIQRIVMNTSDSDSLSLRERIGAACPGDTILFDAGISMDTVKLSGPVIELNKPLVIQGLGEAFTLISGQDNSRIFHVLNGIEVDLFDISLIRGDTLSSGEVLLNQGLLNVHNVRVSRMLSTE